MLLLAFLAFASTSTTAQWVCKGNVKGGTFYNITDDHHGKYYAIADYRLYQSIDSGATWTQVGDSTMYSVPNAFGPRYHRDCYRVVTDRDGTPYVTTVDGIGTWNDSTKQYSKVSNKIFGTLFIDRSNRFYYLLDQLYISNDSGKSWSDSLIVSTDRPQYFIGQDAQGEIVLEDSMRAVYRLNPVTHEIHIVYDLTSSPRLHSPVIAGNEILLSGRNTFYHTTDEGRSWQLDPAPLPVGSTIAFAGESYYYALSSMKDTLFRMHRGRKEWTVSYASTATHRWSYYDPNSTTIILYENWLNGYPSLYEQGYRISKDDGLTWKYSGIPDSNAVLTSVFFNDLVTLHDEVYHTNSFTAHLEDVPHATNSTFDLIAPLSACPNGDVLSRLHAYLYRSLDSGNTWSFYCTTPLEESLRDSVLLATKDCDDLWIYANRLLYHSTDQGLTWPSFPLPADTTCNRIFMLQGSSSLYAEAAYAVYWLSADSNWIKIPIYTSAYSRVGNRDTLIFTDGLHLYKTLDNGLTLQRIDPIDSGYMVTLGSLNDLVAISGYTTVYGIFYSQDLGEHWVDISYNLPRHSYSNFVMNDRGDIITTIQGNVWVLEKAMLDIRIPHINTNNILANLQIENNPVSSHTHLSVACTASTSHHVAVTVYDLLGHSVASIAMHSSSDRTLEAEWSTSELPNGVYIIHSSDIPMQAARVVVQH